MATTPNKPQAQGPSAADAQAMMLARLDDVCTAIEDSATYLQVIAQTLLTMTELQLSAVAARDQSGTFAGTFISSEGVLMRGTKPAGPVLFDEGSSPETKPEDSGNAGD